MILSGPEIRQQIALGRINVEPYNPDRVNPVSVDLTLGDEVAVYERFTTRPLTNPNQPYDGRHLEYVRELVGDGRFGHDTKTEIATRKYKIDPELGWVLNPGVCYLMHTAERVHTRDYVPILDGKSSIGRLFIQVHVTAGFGDPGFDGQYTLEVTSQFPVRVYPGMRICQMRFHVIDGDVDTYEKAGNYVGARALGPVGSRAHISAFK